MDLRGLRGEAVIDPYTPSPFRFCRDHEVYFVEGDAAHAECDSYALMWNAVEYHLERYRKLRATVQELRLLL